MKKYFYFAAAAIALASCASDEIAGGDNGGGQPKDGAISFNNVIPAATRGDKTGAEAGNILKNFYVLGTKGTEQTTSPTTTLVFDNYKVVYGTGTAGTQADNTDDWQYVGVGVGENNHIKGITEQSVKYWDYSAAQYDFIAYSVGANTLVKETSSVADDKVYGSAINTPTTTAPTSFTLQVNSVNDLKECYFTDVTEVLNANYGTPVSLKFKQLAAKVRVAFYETIPGYSVSNLEFYQDAATKLNADIAANTDATLIGTGFATAGTIEVSYPKVGTENESDKAFDKAAATITATAGKTTTVQQFGAVNYANAKNLIDVANTTVTNENYLAETAKEASMAGAAGDSYYTSVFPVSTSSAITLRVNYTLTSNDGSEETIKVYGATAVIPATYTNWQPNYAYTYIFKISDNTNGWTKATDAVSGDSGKDGLFPITFDAVVAAVDDASYNQETITTVATPSLTTYAFNSTDKKVVAAYGNGNEYKAATTTDIYVSVNGNTDISSGIVYKVTDASTTVPATEANVIDALQMQKTVTSEAITGYNSLVLTPTTGDEAAVYTTTSVPTEDGKGITVDAKSVAKFTATATATTYAYVYKVADGTPSFIYTAVPGNGTTTAGTDEYYTDHTGATAIVNGTTLASGTTYYKKITNNNNTYAVKVIKTY